MGVASEPSATPAADPLRHAAPPVDDVEARRARTSIESRLFGGPPQPVRVGRYRIEGRIGAGGMGVVYRAHDPELARDVAVKLMSSDAAHTKDPATARARLVREARAMARLAHPNVLHVYDVGTTDDGVFIAMELVEGRSLASRYEAERPPWREIVRHYVDAGRGLAAAHAADVIHRDFKPENVLVGTDGRVRVCDFGLAGGPAAQGSTTSEDSELDRDTGDLHGPSGSLTKTGALLGTPKYMAPEQESGGLASARSDQFSFCVAIYEALYGFPPFAGTTVAEYRHNVRHGRVLDPPPESKVRGWVHAEIVRGLAVDPADRHPALDPLLDRLEEALVDPNVARRRRRRARVLSLAGGVAGVLVAGVLGVMLATDDDAAVPTAAASTPQASVPAPSSVTTEPALPAEPAVEDIEGIEGIAARAAEPSEALVVGPPPASSELPASTEPDPSTEPDERARPTTSKRKRDGGTCYFQQDKFNYLQRTRKTTRFVTAKDGRCYDCGVEAPDYRRAQLSPTDCARYYLCVAADEDQCKG
ncbi:protein kinase domain-containing protein [Paraliomyxa miuraensis]|uniref:protein kinase domain-containing protein n=1 Tax=Paraliomyxa miuraensis TaxID=376150 RepID=UPI00225A4109|nr:protein kinase [Paraliomyxa miuraensis]MCX4240066.1 protein kinase [Paraliomyxa miuraensis]